MYGRCMNIHAMSQACHHVDGMVRANHGTCEVESHVVGKNHL